MNTIRTALAPLTFAAALCAPVAHAATPAELAYHPALAKARPAVAAIDASTFIPGHPARGAAGTAPAAPVASTTAPAAPARTVAAAR